jgi:hypothetical protein
MSITDEPTVTTNEIFFTNFSQASIFIESLSVGSTKSTRIYINKQKNKIKFSYDKMIKSYIIGEYYTYH